MSIWLAPRAGTLNTGIVMIKTSQLKATYQSYVVFGRNFHGAP